MADTTHLAVSFVTDIRMDVYVKDTAGKSHVFRFTDLKALHCSMLTGEKGEHNANRFALEDRTKMCACECEFLLAFDRAVTAMLAHHSDTGVVERDYADLGLAGPSGPLT